MKEVKIRTETFQQEPRQSKINETQNVVSSLGESFNDCLHFVTFA